MSSYSKGRAWLTVLCVAIVLAGTVFPTGWTSSAMVVSEGGGTSVPAALQLSPTIYLPVVSARWPTELPDIEGVVFFDMNASTKQDDATGIDGPGINHFFPEHIGKDGQIVTVHEPGLLGIEVCAHVAGHDYCDTTDAYGRYAISGLDAADGAVVHLDLADPNAGNPLAEMRVIIEFDRWQHIPANETGPEQNLVVSLEYPIEEGIDVVVGATTNIGLMQGPVIMPIDEDVYAFILENDADPNRIGVLEGFDHDPSDGVLGYSGDRNRCPGWNNCNPKPPGSISHFNGTWNTHTGEDYGWAGDPEDYPGPTGDHSGRIPIYATHNASTYYYQGDDGNIDTSINFVVGPDLPRDLQQPMLGITTSNQHLNGIDEFFRTDQEEFHHPSQLVIRGQRIAFMGITASNYRPGNDQTHLHFELWTGSPFPQLISHPRNPYPKDFYAVMVSEAVVPGFNDLNRWTVYNSPIFPELD